MCLDRVEKHFVDPKDEDWKIGYKIFSYCTDFNDNIIGILSQFLGTNIYEKNRIYVDPNDYYIPIEYPIEDNIIHYYYQTGFHIYSTYIEAKKMCSSNCFIAKIKYRKVCATGYQVDCKVIVAREMEILEECKNE